MAEPQVATQSPFDNFIEYVKQALEIVKLQPEAIDRASKDENAFTMGLIVIAVGGVAMAIGSLAIFGVVAFPILLIVGAFIGAGIFHLLATLAFKGEGEFIQFFRPFSLAYVLTWVNVVPLLNVVLGFVAWIWMLAVTVLIVERTYSLERPQAIATVAIPVVVLFVLAMLFGAFLASMLFVMASMAN